jgi:hypothetical protein
MSSWKASVREINFSSFPPLQGGTKGGNDAIEMIANHFSSILLVEQLTPNSSKPVRFVEF